MGLYKGDEAIVRVPPGPVLILVGEGEAELPLPLRLPVPAGGQVVDVVAAAVEVRAEVGQEGPDHVGRLVG